jgi:hypothetical protein
MVSEDPSGLGNVVHAFALAVSKQAPPSSLKIVRPKSKKVLTFLELSLKLRI